MKTIRIKRRNSSSMLRIAELKQFLGKYVDVFVIDRSKSRKRLATHPAAGILSKYKNPSKTVFEKAAWTRAVIDKH